VNVAAHALTFEVMFAKELRAALRCVLTTLHVVTRPQILALISINSEVEVTSCGIEK
jgi:hypothetical protein